MGIKKGMRREGGENELEREKKKKQDYLFARQK